MYWFDNLLSYLNKYQEEFAKETGINKSTLSTMRRAKTPIEKMNASNLRKIKKTYGLSDDWLFGRYGK